MVPLVGQTLGSTVADDVNDIAHAVGLQIDRHRDDAMLLEVAREGVTSSAAKSTTLTHCVIFR